MHSAHPAARSWPSASTNRVFSTASRPLIAPGCQAGEHGATRYRRTRDRDRPRQPRRGRHEGAHRCRPRGADALHGPEFGEVVDTVERLGFDSLWLSERISGEAPDPIVAMSYAAGRTTQLKFGMSVLVLPGRNPIVLAKELATLAVLSGGRLLPAFGLGVADGMEHQAFGVERKRAGEDVRRGAAVMRKAGTTTSSTTTATASTTRACGCGPQPKRLDVWLGGIAPSELKRVGRLADGWLPSFVTPADVAAGRDVIEQVAAEHEREIEDDHYGVLIPYAMGAVPDRCSPSSPGAGPTSRTRPAGPGRLGRRASTRSSASSTSAPRSSWWSRWRSRRRPTTGWRTYVKRPRWRASTRTRERACSVGVVGRQLERHRVDAGRSGSPRRAVPPAARPGRAAVPPSSPRRRARTLEGRTVAAHLDRRGTHLAATSTPGKAPAAPRRGRADTAPRPTRRRARARPALEHGAEDRLVVHDQRGEVADSPISWSIAASSRRSSGDGAPPRPQRAGRATRSKPSDPAQAARERDRYLRWVAGDAD